MNEYIREHLGRSENECAIVMYTDVSCLFSHDALLALSVPIDDQASATFKLVTRKSFLAM